MVRIIIVTICCSLAYCSIAGAADWLLNPSTYTHDPETGERVTQFAPEEPAFFHDDPTYVQSGYRHTQNSRRGPGRSQENLHITEEWGRPVRPYEEWQYPYRPYSVPYQLWGAPYGGLTPFFGPDVPFTNEPDEDRSRFLQRGGRHHPDRDFHDRDDDDDRRRRHDHRRHDKIWPVLPPQVHLFEGHHYGVHENFLNPPPPPHPPAGP